MIITMMKNYDQSVKRNLNPNWPYIFDIYSYIDPYKINVIEFIETSMTRY